MTIEKALELRRLEEEGKLPLPRNMVVKIPAFNAADITAEQKQELDIAKKELINLDSLIITFGKMFAPTKQETRVLKEIVVDKAIEIEIKNDKDIEGFSEQTIDGKIKLLLKLSIKKNPIIEKLSGNGTFEEPFEIKTKYGEGIAFDAKEFFDGIWPPFLKPHECYYNAGLLTKHFMRAGCKTKQLTGLIYTSKPYCHSVTYFETNSGKQYILDSNYHLVMSYNLYKALFAFDVLNEIEGSDIISSSKLLDKYGVYCKKQGKKFTYDMIAFSFDDIIAQAKKLGLDDGVGV